MYVSITMQRMLIEFVHKYVYSKSISGEYVWLMIIKI